MTAVVSTYTPMSHLEGLKVSSPSDDKRLTPQSILEIVDSLKHGGLEQIEQKLRAVDEQRPTVKHDSYSDIPVIDLSRAAAEADVVSQQLGDAACQWGIFQIVNHGISVETLQTTQQLVYRAEMLVLNHGPTLRNTGNKIIDDMLALMWPEGNAQLRDAFITFTSGLRPINHQILRLFAQYWGLKEDFFAQHFDYDNIPSSTLRWNYYPRCPEPSAVLGSNEHTDPFSLTFLMQDKVGGLQVRRAGQWYGVRPVEGALVVNVGDCLHAWTNGRFKSVYHRAVLNEQVDRISLATFVYPHLGAPISTADKLIDEDHPRVYKPFVYAEFWNKSIEARAKTHKLGTRVNDGVRMLDNFKIHQ